MGNFAQQWRSRKLVRNGYTVVVGVAGSPNPKAKIRIYKDACVGRRCIFIFDNWRYFSLVISIRV